MDDSLDPRAHDRAELARLHRFCTRPGPAFGLAMVRFHDFAVAREARSAVQAQLEGEGVPVAGVGLGRDDEDRDIAAALTEASARAQVVWLTGLHTLLRTDSDQPRHARAIMTFNYGRDELPEQISARVVLWIHHEAYPEFARQAWDLVSVMLTEFELRERRQRHHAPPVPRGAVPLSAGLSFMSDDDEDDVPDDDANDPKEINDTEDAPNDEPLGLDMREQQAKGFTVLADRAPPRSISRAEALMSAATLDIENSDIERARASYRAAIEAYPDDHAAARAAALVALADLERAEGHDQLALDHARAALAELPPSDVPSMTRAEAHALLARLHAGRGEPVLALDHAQCAAFELGKRTAFLAKLGEVQLLLARLHLQAGDVDSARTQLDSMIPLLDQIDAPQLRSEHAAAQAQVLEALGHMEAGLERRRTHQLPFAIGPVARAEAIFDIADTLQTLDRPPEALALLEANRPLLERTFATRYRDYLDRLTSETTEDP